MTIFRITFGGLALTVALSLCGCGGSNGPSGSGQTGPTVEAALQDLADLLKAAKRPPNRQADLEPHEAVHLSATLAITQKTVIYYWGQGLTGGQAVVAHDTKAATDGGFVLLQNGSVKSMTADEFKAAPKAKK